MCCLIACLGKSHNCAVLRCWGSNQGCKNCNAANFTVEHSTLLPLCCRRSSTGKTLWLTLPNQLFVLIQTCGYIFPTLPLFIYHLSQVFFPGHLKITRSKNMCLLFAYTASSDKTPRDFKKAVCNLLTRGEKSQTFCLGLTRAKTCTWGKRALSSLVS